MNSEGVLPWVPALGLFLAGLLLAAVISDLRTRRIPNGLIVTGWLVSLGWHWLAPRANWAFDHLNPGALGPAGALAGAGVMLLAFMPFYALRIMGAGDVKLMSVVGAAFGASLDAWTQLAGVSLFVLAAGGLLALARMLLSGSMLAVIANLRLILGSFYARISGLAGPSFDARTDSVDRMPYAVAIAIGTLFYLVSKWAGWITNL